MKNIISFYLKAKSYDHLATFFESCSMVEIDEYRDFEKAIAALKEAVKHANRMSSPEKEARLEILNKKI